MEGSQSAMSRLTAQEGTNPRIREMEKDALTSAAANNGLGKLVQRYQVCWEVWSEYSAVGPGNGLRRQFIQPTSLFLRQMF